MTSVIICTPTIKLPFPGYIGALESSVPALDAAGIEHQFVAEVGSTYISWARANMLMKALKTDADAFVFLDHDLSWMPEDMVRLVLHPGDVVAGTYRYKSDPEEYMGTWLTDEQHRPITRPDGTIEACGIPAGFLKVSRGAVERFRDAYPELVFGKDRDYIDLFNHGAHAGLWWGEDFAFSRRWRDIGGEIHLIPDLNIAHHTEHRVFAGNLHEFLMRQPGGSRHVDRNAHLLPENEWRRAV